MRLQQEIAWHETIKTSQDQLSQPADEAIWNFKSGKTKQTDW